MKIRNVDVPSTSALEAEMLAMAPGRPTIAEKIEGLAWGPDLSDGRHVLYVISDNDLNPNLDTQIYAFAIDPSLIDFERQFLPLPVYPPWLIPRD